MTSNEVPGAAGGDGETYDEYSARMKATFPAQKVHEATRGLPASGTHTRVPHGLPLAPEEVAGRPVEYVVFDQLTALVKQAAGEPELLFVATDALGDEMERLGMAGKELTAVRNSARAVKQTIGHSADTVWKTLSWWEQIRNRKHKAHWKHAHTSALLLESFRLVDAILEGR
ncbi:hypothetical protein [Pseudarthrobacter sp. BIM B-2242]|uniref:hypothetical protein n=1 Tax=Pseudarthrobacter sp. BIM B-2242 TaxID=2772401 RepID=UPI00168ADDD4|nr:hypothetical protein [Pseudarthrobacter sp. BIM B-2242]QOD05957.1 hypothetical protein IDT60_20525 [Pseudarthrobacter sp. BIM B-2242]